ncbi:MAG: efflux RND transporter periplasmic adaptor subunit [Gemmatimonadaceae bacterium]|nr:efflux RND transporter periplasmic adaptor subunit [Gemmatimonadaceae bacterium]
MTTNNTLIVLAALALSACRGDADAKSATDALAVPVAVATVTSGSATQPVVATGTFGSRDEIPLSFKIGGVIARVLADEGTPVRKGQLLASLDLREIDALVDKARVGMDKAERDAARVKRLAADSVATQVQAQDALSAFDAARADYATARVNREYATIVAPENGTVLTRQATAGTTIGAGMPVLTMGGSARGRVLRVSVPDRDALRVHVGDVAVVHFDAMPNTVYRGAVSLVGQSANVRTGTYVVEIALRDADALRAGLVGRAAIAVRSTSAATLVPVDALLEADADSATVYTVGASEPLIAEPHKVRITQLVGDNAAVTGLENGARVITRGAPYVTAGARVRIASLPGSDKSTPSGSKP